jgi:hypothetical protein
MALITLGANAITALPCISTLTKAKAVKFPVKP